MTYEIKRLDLATIDVSPYEHLVDEQNRCYLHCQNPYGIKNVSYIAVAASMQNKPSGIILASVVPLVRTADIHFLNVLDFEHNQEVAKSLFAKLKEELLPYRCLVAIYLYHANEKATPFLESAFLEEGWASPKPYIMRYFLHSDTFHPPWLERNRSYLRDFEVFFWKDLTPKEREILKYQEIQYTFHPFVSPLPLEANLEPLNSLGLRYKGHVIGWVITTRVDLETIRYAALYIDPDFQGQGPIIKLLSDSIALQRASGIPKGMFEINLPLTDAHWRSFIDRRLAPYATSIVEIKRTWLDLRLG